MAFLPSTLGAGVGGSAIGFSWRMVVILAVSALLGRLTSAVGYLCPAIGLLFMLADSTLGVRCISITDGCQRMCLASCSWYALGITFRVVSVGFVCQWNT